MSKTEMQIDGNSSDKNDQTMEIETENDHNINTIKKSKRTSLKEQDCNGGGAYVGFKMPYFTNLFRHIFAVKTHFTLIIVPNGYLLTYITKYLNNFTNSNIKMIEVDEIMNFQKNFKRKRVKVRIYKMDKEEEVNQLTQANYYGLFERIICINTLKFINIKINIFWYINLFKLCGDQIQTIHRRFLNCNFFANKIIEDIKIEKKELELELHQQLIYKNIHNKLKSLLIINGNLDSFCDIKKLKYIKSVQCYPITQEILFLNS
eukprot:110144_1